MRTRVVRTQSERSATASNSMVFTMDASFASGLRGSVAFSNRQPRSYPATIHLDRAIWPQPKRAGTASQSPMFY
jgi:hypothetical protein